MLCPLSYEGGDGAAIVEPRQPAAWLSPSPCPARQIEAFEEGSRLG